MELSIRPAVPADRTELAAMLHEVAAHFAAMAGGELDTLRNWDDLERCADLCFADPPWCTTLIAKDAGRPIGYLAYTFGVYEIFPALHVAGLYVRAEARGKGVGKALMAEVQRMAAERGATHTDWMVWRKNDPALAFYRGLGATIYDDDVMMVMPVAAGPSS